MRELVLNNIFLNTLTGQLCTLPWEEKAHQVMLSWNSIHVLVYKTGLMEFIWWQVLGALTLLVVVVVVRYVLYSTSPLSGDDSLTLTSKELSVSLRSNKLIFIFITTVSSLRDERLYIKTFPPWLHNVRNKKHVKLSVWLRLRIPSKYATKQHRLWGIRFVAQFGGISVLDSINSL